MQYLGLSLTIALITFQGGSAQRATSRIVNGADARPGEFPYQISIQLNDLHGCGGSILNENYVLTAAHCIPTNDTGTYKIIAGTTNVLELAESATIHNVTEIHVHNKYNESDGWNNDIAVLRVEPPFAFNKYIAPAKLPRKNAVVPPGKKAVISGFGRIERGGFLSPTLLKTTVSITTLKYCQKNIFGDPVRSTNVCTQNTSADTGFCNGDSGGPLTVDRKVVGIVSFGPNGGCAVRGRSSPQVFTKVSAYIDWIFKQMKKGAKINQ